MNFEIIETQRLKLRISTPELYKSVFETMSDHELKLFLGSEDIHVIDRERNKAKLGMTTYNRSFKMFHLIEKETNRVIGACGYHNWLAEHNRSEIGYHLNHEHDKRKGFMSEALARIITYGFNEMNLNRIEACVGPQNLASNTLIKKMHFTQEGILREHFYVDGKNQDSIMYSLLRHEYEQFRMEEH